MIPPSYLFKELYDDWFQPQKGRRTLFGRYASDRMETVDDFRPARGRLRVRD